MIIGNEIQFEFPSYIIISPKQKKSFGEEISLLRRNQLISVDENSNWCVYLLLAYQHYIYLSTISIIFGPSRVR